MLAVGASASTGMSGPGSTTTEDLNIPHQNDGNRIPLPQDEAPVFAGYAAHVAALDPADLIAEVAERRAETKAAADTGEAKLSRQAAVAQSIAQDEAERRSGPSDQMSAELRQRHGAALAAILDLDAALPNDGPAV